MKKIFLCSLATVSLFLGTAQAAEYEIDPVHSSVGFKIKHLGISTVPGRFGDFKGTFTYTPDNLLDSKTNASISVASIDTDNKKRDEHLQADDFFNTSKFPSITFTSKKVEPTSGGNFNIHGDLTMHGVTKPVVLEVTPGGIGKGMQGEERAAFSAKTVINRKDWGLDWNKTLELGRLAVGDEVRIELEVEGVKKTA